MLLTDKKLYEKVRKDYDDSDVLKFLLACDEIHTQLAIAEKLTIAGIFQYRVVDILYNSNSRPVLEEGGPEEMGYANITVSEGVRQAFNHDLMPISENGEILCRLDEGERGHLVSKL